jgi:lipoate-protein ligase A
MKTSANTWRLIETKTAPGAWNMAVDEAILEAAGRREVLPTLRLYSWSPPCLSLGYAQTITDLDYSRLQARCWDLVRRPTGGKAILHTDELTYAVIAPTSEPRLAGSVLESYQRLSKALLYALDLLGIPATADEKAPGNSNHQDNNPVCFEIPSNYEITFQGRKLIGSAQARRKGSVLQHGSLPLCGDLSRIVQVLHYESETARQAAAKRLLARAATVESILDHPVTWESARDAFVPAFEQILDIRFQNVELTAPEQARASELVEQKYAHPSWTERV